MRYSRQDMFAIQEAKEKENVEDLYAYMSSLKGWKEDKTLARKYPEEFGRRPGVSNSKAYMMDSGKWKGLMGVKVFYDNSRGTSFVLVVNAPKAGWLTSGYTYGKKATLNALKSLVKPGSSYQKNLERLYDSWKKAKEEENKEIGSTSIDPISILPRWRSFDGGGVLVSPAGAPGGGFPSGLDFPWVREIENLFDKEWDNYADLEEDDDPLNASETVYGDASGWVALHKDKRWKADKYVGGIEYWSVTLPKRVDVAGEKFYVTAGVSGV